MLSASETYSVPPDRGVPAVRGSSPKVDSASEELTDVLSTAADCLARGDDAGAANYLARHVASNPEQIVFAPNLPMSSLGSTVWHKRNRNTKRRLPMLRKVPRRPATGW